MHTRRSTRAAAARLLTTVALGAAALAAGLLFTPSPRNANVSFAGSSARADMAPPDVQDLRCDRGAVATVPEVDPEALDVRGRPVRPYTFCAPTTCASDDDCDEGRSCSAEAIDFCVEDREVEGGATVRAVRTSPCQGDGVCLNIHATCETSRRCVEGAEPTAAEATEPAPGDEGADDEDGEGDPTAEGPGPQADTSASGCGCRAAGRTGGAPLALLGLAGLGVALRRRR